MPAATRVLAVAIWVGFIGVLFAMELANATLPVLTSIAGVGLPAAVLGVFANRWVKHI